MIINLFYTTQDIHKILIQSSYNDYKTEKINFKNNHSYYQGTITINDYNNLDEQNKKEWDNYVIKVSTLQKIAINNLLQYTKIYPNEKISNNRFINEYIEFPYRLEQNLTEVLLDL